MSSASTTDTGPAPGCFGLLGVSLVVDPTTTDADRLFSALCLAKSACEAFDAIDAEDRPGWWAAMYTLRQAVILLEAPRAQAAPGATS